ncbi:MAG: FAD-binding oxidoreductase [Candidatus Krumholzibacteriota bacterium]|nr:FAD-binding oxidoreductase [Candidatus Krumholzibacteriota bacterium]
MKAAAIYIPESPEEASRFFRGITELKAGGSNVSISFAVPDGKSPARYSGRRGSEELLKMAADLTDSEPFHIVISSERFSAVKEVSKHDLLAVAGGGTTLGSLRGAVDDEGLFLPFDQDIFDETMTLAELVMNGAASRWEGRYGSIRESILSLGIVAPSGEIIHSGSHSVKDVAGYEIIGFVSGSGGRCGMIHSVTARLLPRPAAVSFLVFSGDPADLEEAAKKIFRIAAPVSTEIYHGSAARLMAGGFEPGGSSLMISEIHLPVAEVEKQLSAKVAEALSKKSVAWVHGYRGEPVKGEFSSSVMGHFGNDRLLASLVIDLKRKADPDEAGFSSDRKVFPDEDDYSSNEDVPQNEDDYLYWTAYFPMRGHYLWAAEKQGSTYTLPRGIEGSIIGNIAPGARVRFELLSVKDSSLRRNRLPVDSLAGSYPGLFRAVTNGEVISEISEKIYRLFDPERIILV